jgi:hypothetical protein
MANQSNFNATPNLLELLQAYDNEAKRKARGGLSIYGGESKLPGSLIELSLCADDATDTIQRSLWADAPLIDQSVCDDEGPDGPSVCADEPIESDVRLKTDIEQAGTTLYGLPLYHFRYRTGTERFEGVMAQDVLEVMPNAVVMGEDGYYRVRYGRLGIKMKRA